MRHFDLPYDSSRIRSDEEFAEMIDDEFVPTCPYSHEANPTSSVGPHTIWTKGSSHDLTQLANSGDVS